jgi:hypothetical protein
LNEWRGLDDSGTALPRGPLFDSHDGVGGRHADGGATGILLGSNFQAWNSEVERLRVLHVFSRVLLLLVELSLVFDDDETTFLGAVVVLFAVAGIIRGAHEVVPDYFFFDGNNFSTLGFLGLDTSCMNKPTQIVYKMQLSRLNDFV